ncbi:secretion protein HlyD [Leptolinea sp. HRD-7]|nr:secretion protein HlyD [Leptolinea sp. HRD-7]
MIKRFKLPSRKAMMIIGVVLLVIVGITGYLFLNNKPQRRAISSFIQQGSSTSTVKKGDISVKSNGTGTLVANRLSKLSFSIDGIVDEVNVKVGEKVKEGQILAKLKDISSLTSTVTSTKLALLSAQQELQTLKNNAPAALGNAQLTVTADKSNLDDAIAGQIKDGQTRCDSKTTASYYDKYMVLQNKYDELNDGSTAGNYYLTVIVPARDAALQAFAKYKYCAEYKSYEVDAAEAKLNIAKAQLQIDEAKLSTLQANNGIDPVELATAENKVAVAQAAYDTAVSNLENATLVAPFDGTILSIAGMEGDRVDSETVFMTIADDVHPQIEFVVDESDLQNIALDQEAEVTFDAIEGRKFTGTVTQINPTLTSTSGYSTISGIITLNMDDVTDVPNLFQGLTASVTLYKGNAKDALIIPVSALRDLGDGKYGVFTIEKDNSMKLNFVEVGLKDSTNAEILSGLELGQTVSTGITEQ